LTGLDRHQLVQTGTDRHLPAQNGLDRNKTGTDWSGLFYDVFDAHFVLNSPKRYDILKILIKYVIKQPGPVGVGLVPVGIGLVPVQSGRCRSCVPFYYLTNYVDNS
jgi:hypothetical protein